MPQPDSDDEFPDDIGHLDLSNVPGLQELPVASLIRPFGDPLRPVVPASPSQLPRPSLPSEYDYDDEIDESTLAACDAMEAQFAQDRHRPEGQSIHGELSQLLYAIPRYRSSFHCPVIDSW
jgi:hypothetical protein